MTENCLIRTLLYLLEYSAQLRIPIVDLNNHRMHHSHTLQAFSCGSSFNIQNITESGYIEDFTDDIVYMGNLQAALLAHHFMCTEQNTQSGG